MVRPPQGRFLPDRYVEGTCYICGYTNARGDQCDQCGNLLDAAQLIDPRSKIDGSTPELRETEHFYLDLGKLQPASRRVSCASASATGAPTCCASRLGRSWPTGCTGAPSPATWIGASPCRWRAGRASACTSGSRRSSATSPPPSSGRRSTASPKPGTTGGHDPDAQAYYFIGKDNIPFHAVIWPAQLIGAGEAFDKLFEGSRGQPARPCPTMCPPTSS